MIKLINGHLNRDHQSHPSSIENKWTGCGKKKSFCCCLRNYFPIFCYLEDTFLNWKFNLSYFAPKFTYLVRKTEEQVT